jgi:homoserine kinase
VSRASAPASSANLGPGFDVVALALDIRCAVTLSAADRWSVDSAGSDEDTKLLVRRAVEAASADLGPLAVVVESDIPVAHGLGSSAALIVAIVAAARAAAGADRDGAEIFRIAASVEGHPDNVGAAVFGGAIAVGPGPMVHRLEVHPSIGVLLGVPATRLSTAKARLSVGGPVRTGVAVRTAARLAFLVEGLRTGDPSLLAAAGGDELHEARRAHLSPLTGRLIEAAREAGALHAAWSGAGPSAVAFVTQEHRASVAAAFEEVLAGEGGKVLEPAIDTEGVILD